ncbi:glycosyltransferase family 4 protein [Dyadobacter chenwenxiniae]|uniref:Glycosyltransferase family 4 protein n=1 Tax=Dyadobacter chenwenxiniae TaxID=2906456 RepID=A0A9X1PQ05_9BACT|nr:glycosyltransferase family 4 protein [Dyadobacter chenwenxiniae]MCF0062721.1 glycosyltransferase family 4 protein [Dyadobacter chenwenxiniae]UON83534.1 glycosyltransferase family 4 protein [Dyadobacter chenwenxiniae]
MIAHSTKKILIIGQTPPPYGGQSIMIGKIVSFLDKSDFDYKLIRMNFSEEMDQTGKWGLMKIFKLFKILFSIIYTLLSYKPDYVYYPPSGFERVPIYRDIILLFFVRLLRFKVIFHFHAGGLTNIYESLSPFFKKTFEFVFFYPDYSICMSESGTADPLFLKCKDITIIPYGVDDLRIAGDIQKQNQDRFSVLFVGVCRETKGILDYLDVIRRANKIDPRIRGQVVGKAFGTKEANALDLAVKEGLITYHGIKIGQEKINVFNESDLFLFPTFFEHENFPTVNLEAFSCGLPVISTKWRGVVNQITDGYNGYIHDVHGVESMAASIVKILNDKSLYSQLSQGARSSYEQYYSVGVFEKNIINFFNSLK